VFGRKQNINCMQVPVEIDGFFFCLFGGRFGIRSVIITKEQNFEMFNIINVEFKLGFKDKI
jgi:hypothetical protein